LFIGSGASLTSIASSGPNSQFRYIDAVSMSRGGTLAFAGYPASGGPGVYQSSGAVPLSHSLLYNNCPSGGSSRLGRWRLSTRHRLTTKGRSQSQKSKTQSGQRTVSCTHGHPEARAPLNSMLAT
jgi:hypothetical protein